MHILMVTDFYWPFLGGVEQHVRTLSHTLHARGHTVTVATLGGAGLAQTETDCGVRVCRLTSSTQRARWLFKAPTRTWAPPFPDPEITLGLRRIIDRERPDIVHGHDWLARSFLPLKRWSQAKLVMSLHYYTLSCAKKDLMVGDVPCGGPAFVRCLGCVARHYGTVKGTATVLGNWGLGMAERRAVDMYIAVSRATAQGNRLGEHLPQQVIANFLPEPAPEAQGELAPYLAELPDEPFLLFVGDLRRAKGLHILLEAYAELSGAPPLVLIGKTWHDTPRELPPNTLLFKDWPNVAVRAAWQRSLVGIVPSIWPEPFGIVLIEAMAGGSPVIASQIGGIAEIVIDGETGLLVPPGEPPALRAALARLIDDPALCRRMGEAARQRAADFAAGTVVPQIEAVYQRLLES